MFDVTDPQFEPLAAFSNNKIKKAVLRWKVESNDLSVWVCEVLRLDIIMTVLWDVIPCSLVYIVFTDVSKEFSSSIFMEHECLSPVSVELS